MLANIRKIHEMGNAPVTLTACPLMHGTGLWLGGFVTFNMGGTHVSMEGTSFDAHRLWQTIQREGVTDIVIVGDAFAKPMLRALEEAEARGEPYDLSSVKLIISSGVMWTSSVKQALLERNEMLLIDIMGSSEGAMGQNITTRELAPGTAKFQLSEAGKVFTEDDREVEPGSGEVGMLAHTGVVPLGYYKDPEKSARTFRTVNGSALRLPRRLRDGRGGWLDHAARARLGLHQLGRREDLPGGGRRGRQAPSRRLRLPGGRGARREVRRGGHRRGVVADRRIGGGSRDPRQLPRSPGELQAPQADPARRRGSPRPQRKGRLRVGKEHARASLGLD